MAALHRKYKRQCDALAQKVYDYSIFDWKSEEAAKQSDEKEIRLQASQELATQLLLRKYGMEVCTVCVVVAVVVVGVFAVV